MTADPHVLGPGLAPTPFTDQDIRGGCPEGRTVRLRIEASGEAPSLLVNRFRDVDADGATLEAWPLGPDELPAGDRRESRVTWKQLQAHASFPVDATTITPDVIETELGRLDCLRYDVRRDAGLDTFWFAIKRPGMPVRYATIAGPGESSLVTMIEDRLT